MSLRFLSLQSHFPLAALCAVGVASNLHFVRSAQAPKAAPAKIVAHPHAAQQAAKTAAQAKAFETEIRPLISELCGDCHGPENPRAGVNLERFTSLQEFERDPKLWRNVLEQVHDGAMPPKNKKQPTPEQHERLVSWIKASLEEIDSRAPRDPGRKIFHRLNRSEYNNTLRDLLGIASKPADNFPADGSGGGGFDNNADTLFVPPILMEKYLDAATQVLAEAKPTRIFAFQTNAKRDAKTTAKLNLEKFASRAFRRPATQMEIARLMQVYGAGIKRGQSPQNATKTAMKAVLISPHFLFRIEADKPSKTPYRVNDYELASRLSYFLWSSMPDEELFRLAAQKKLSQPQVLAGQVKRMMNSPKFAAFANGFAGQWLRVRELYGSVAPDPNKFPNYTPTLRDAMYNETITFFQDIVRSNGSVLRLLDADYSFMNEELAKHYGVEGVKGAQMQRVALKDGKRGGVLTMASVLTLSSYPQRTSPVLRGKWVLEEIMGTPPPPPPPDAGGLSPNDAPESGLTFRQRLEKHREKPQCASCHNKMDPLGFGLENFDAIGKWRDDIGGTPVDAAGVLASGEKFSGPSELKQQVLKRKDLFARNLSERLLSYALGRGIEHTDISTVRAITKKLEANDYRAQTLILEIVQSYPFQFRKNG